MDYDNDGILDFISGSYDPGDVYLFRGEGNGRYAAGASILDQRGLALVHHPKELAEWQALSDQQRKTENGENTSLRVASFGSWPTMPDWDGDGDLDMIIGSFGGDLFLRINEGTRAAPIFNKDAIPLTVAELPMHVNGHGAPVAADWDVDGLWDLVVGSSDGAVGWFRNMGTAANPEFDAYRPLLTPMAEQKFFEQNLAAGSVPTRGVRAQTTNMTFR